jgi:hypothetical protein
MEARDPESAIQCVRLIGEWPPAYIVFPADDVKESLSEALTMALTRSFPTDMPRWRIAAKEARELVELCTQAEVP